jgi:serine/threonine-protein kinase
MNDPSTDRAPRRTGDGLFTLSNRYVAEHELARGGMGTVYAGRDTVLARPVAIKVLLPEPGAEPRNEFLREARAVAALKHPHIVDVYDAGIEGETPYIVMEYVPGETLRELIERDAPLEPVKAAMLTAEIADALHYAHRRGVVHCDIKPGNILLPADDLPKIVDFGIAHSAGATATLTGTVLGTAAYIAPEQVQGQRPDGRTDVYSLAIRDADTAAAVYRA